MAFNILEMCVHEGKKLQPFVYKRTQNTSQKHFHESMHVPSLKGALQVYTISIHTVLHTKKNVYIHSLLTKVNNTAQNIISHVFDLGIS